MKSLPPPPFISLSRASLLMCGLAGLFWFTSWPFISVGRDFPNCVSAKLDVGGSEIRFVSIHHHCVFFLTTMPETPGRSGWWEASDGHFCGFSLSPFDSSGLPQGFAIYANSEQVGWKCPYLLMALLWGIAFYKTLAGFRISVMDLIAAMTFSALAISLIKSHYVLPLMILLNLGTMLLMGLLALSFLRMTWNTGNIWWPLVVEESPSTTMSGSEGSVPMQPPSDAGASREQTAAD